MGINKIKRAIDKYGDKRWWDNAVLFHLFVSEIFINRPDPSRFSSLEKENSPVLVSRKDFYRPPASHPQRTTRFCWQKWRSCHAIPLGRGILFHKLSLRFCGGEIGPRERERSFTLGQTFVPANKKRVVTSVIGRM